MYFASPVAIGTGVVGQRKYTAVGISTLYAVQREAKGEQGISSIQRTRYAFTSFHLRSSPLFLSPSPSVRIQVPCIEQGRQCSLTKYACLGNCALQLSKHCEIVLLSRGDKKGGRRRTKKKKKRPRATETTRKAWFVSLALQCLLLTLSSFLFSAKQGGSFSFRY